DRRPFPGDGLGGAGRTGGPRSEPSAGSGAPHRRRLLRPLLRLPLRRAHRPARPRDAGRLPRHRLAVPPDHADRSPRPPRRRGGFGAARRRPPAAAPLRRPGGGGLLRRPAR
ncbi:MAG TPA: hypothetical protein ENK17_00750, partial [Anaerolineae bacterium]|nr:hypothetical protein [Anaerolineae bacterium]